MKRKEKIVPILIALAFFVLGALPAQAVIIDLDSWAFNVDGSVEYDFSSVFGNDYSDDFNDVTGLDVDVTGLDGLEWTTDVVGDHTFIAFFDHEIDQDSNTFSNEYGTAVGTPDSELLGDDGDQSWEIDEPGYDPPYGDIYYNMEDSTTTTGSFLDNMVFGNVTDDMPNDVSMAMGWDFSLAAGETATISLILSEIMPTAGFYLAQTDPEAIYIDPDTGAETVAPYSIYFSSTLDITGGGPGPGPEPVPEPSTLLLMGIGLMGLLGVQRKRASRKKV